MKKVFFFLALAGTTFVTSCNSDDDNGTTTPVAPVATSIVLTSDVETVEVGGAFTFTVTDDLAADVTSTSTFLVNNVAIESNVFTSTEAGTFTVKAQNGTLESAPVTVTVTAPAIVEADNSIVVDGVNYVTDKSILYYLGTEGNINYWAVNAYNQVGTGAAATYPNDVFIYITSAQVSTTTLELPTITTYTKGVETAVNNIFDVELILNSEDYALFTDVNTVNFNLTAITATSTVQNWSFNYASTLNDGTVISGDFEGDFGFSDETATGKLAVGKNAKIVKTTKAEALAKGKSIVGKK